MKKREIYLSVLLICSLFSCKNSDFDCPIEDSFEPFTETIYLNLDLGRVSGTKWQLCHAELGDNIKPFVILAKIDSEIEDSQARIKKMKFRAEPFLGNQNFYQIVNIKKKEPSRRHETFNMYDVEITVGLKRETVTSNELKNFSVDRLTAFDYHVKMTDELRQFVDCNIELSYNNNLFNDDIVSMEDKICCGAICASRFVY